MQLPTERDDLTPDLGYTPIWTYDGPAGRFGFTVDDGCYLGLTTDEYGLWRATPYIPRVLLRAMVEHLETLGEAYRGFTP